MGPLPLGKGIDESACWHKKLLDEDQFPLSGYLNSQYTHCWDSENPHYSPYSVRRLIGPIFFYVQLIQSGLWTVFWILSLKN